jgi:hypothetical protein
MAKAPKVRLYIRIRRRSDGMDAFVDRAWNRNRIEGQPEHHPEGVYYLRFLLNGKRVWEVIGSDADPALVALRNKEHTIFKRPSLAEVQSAPQQLTRMTPIQGAQLDRRSK